MAVQTLNKNNFKEKTKNIAIIKFEASWCTPCKILAPIYEDISNEIKSPFFKIDVDQEQELAQQFSIMSVPAIIILKQGQEILRINGVMPKETLKNKILSKIL